MADKNLSMDEVIAYLGELLGRHYHRQTFWRWNKDGLLVPGENGYTKEMLDAFAATHNAQLPSRRKRRMRPAVSKRQAIEAIEATGMSLSGIHKRCGKGASPAMLSLIRQGKKRMPVSLHLRLQSLSRKEGI